MSTPKEHTIHTPKGTFVGTVESSGVVSFKGIPYAKPPVGELRWQPPQPLENNSYIMPADKYPPAPIQPDMPESLAVRLGEAIHTPQSEDCLYLNMWCWDVTTPKKAILFWIYGGSYTIGHASRIQERGEAFVANNHDIVVVACNYRLGVFGSLNLSSIDPEEKYTYSCNLNILDQQAALKWVRDNAEFFGGDPDRITLYGHSAGSNSISHHLAISDSANLFQRAICQSSFLIGHGTVSFEESNHAAKKILALIGADSLADALNTSAEKLLSAQIELYGQAYTPPVEDGLTVKSNELGRLAVGELHDKELMIGTSTGEYDQLFVGLSEKEALLKTIARNKKRLGPDPEKKLEAFAEIHPEMSKTLAYATANNELGMTLGGEIQARVCALHNTVYKFLFSWSDPATKMRAPHGAPCPFFFGNNVPKSAPALLEKSLQESWGNFIRTGNPSGPSIPQWHIYSKTQYPTMVIDESWSISNSIWEKDYSFWESSFPETVYVKKEE